MTPHRTAELWETPDGEWTVRLYYRGGNATLRGYSQMHYKTLGEARRAVQDWGKKAKAYVTRCIYRYEAPQTKHFDYSEDDDAD